MTICQYTNCTKRALYNFQNLKTTIYCGVHKLNDMVNINKKSCDFINCYKSPLYNFDGEKPKYCINHKLHNMIMVTGKKCSKCKKLTATFNFQGGKPEYCGNCKKPNMIDIRHPKCIKCKTLSPSFNYIGKSPEYCGNCKENDMIDVKHNKCIKCKKVTPGFNYPGKPARYCSNCKEIGMEDVKNTLFKCLKCELDWRQNKDNSRTICLYCDDSQIHKTKEHEISKLLGEHNISFVNDKRIINDCCNKYRPDFVIECASYFLIVEVDEFQHSQYDQDCEIARMNNISDSLGLPSRFIRYNPDNDKYTKSEKETKLIETIKENMNKDFLKDLETIYLFYTNK